MLFVCSLLRCIPRMRRGGGRAPPENDRRKMEMEIVMAKAQAEEMRTRRGETQVTATFDPSQTLSGLEPIFQVGNKWFENWMAVSSEILEFSRARLDRNLEVSKAIARSSSIDEAMGLHADHARSTVREYFTECGKLADLGARVMLESLMAWQPAAREATREAMQRRSAA